MAGNHRFRLRLGFRVRLGVRVRLGRGATGAVHAPGVGVESPPQVDAHPLAHVGAASVGQAAGADALQRRAELAGAAASLVRGVGAASRLALRGRQRLALSRPEAAGALVGRLAAGLAAALAFVPGHARLVALLGGELVDAVAVREAAGAGGLGLRAARVAAAQVDLEQALADADVARKQLAGQANPSPLALKQPQVARAQSALKAAETALALAQTNLERTEISLPFTGRVESQAADLGQYVNPGKVLGTVFGTDYAEVRLALTANQLSALGVPIGFDGGENGGLPTTLSAVMGGTLHRWQGLLIGLDAAIDPTTRTVYGTVRISDPYGPEQSVSGMPLAVGLYVDAEIQGRLIVDAIQIAAEGLRAGDEVLVLDGEGLLDVRQAEVIHRGRHTALLSAGVEAGELVIVSAIRNPVRGMRLEAMSDGTIAETAPADVTANDNEA